MKKFEIKMQYRAFSRTNDWKEEKSIIVDARDEHHALEKLGRIAKKRGRAFWDYHRYTEIVEI